MAKPEPETTPYQTAILHFSHLHPLHLLNFPLGQIHPCSACKLDASGLIYTCTACTFVLHPKCTQLPHQINHSFDPNHTLTLYPNPVYPEGLFSCDACGKQGAGFCYHCKPCGVDLHTTCAYLPMQLVHQSHHHPLALAFSSPYPGNSFSCDICKMVTSKTWIYRCAACEFDAHLTCVATVVPRTPNPQSCGVSRPLPPAVIANAQKVFVEMPQTNNVDYNRLNQPGYGAPGGVNGLRDQIMVEGGNETTTQAMIQEFLGGVSDVELMGDEGATDDGVSYYDADFGGNDGGYSGGDSSY